MVVCGSCGNTCSPNAVFCGSCGKKVQEVAQSGATCAKCGKVFAEGESKSYFIEAFGSKWHKECFCCQFCNNRIFTIGKFYEVGGRPVCAMCHNKQTPICRGCKQNIQGTVIAAFNYHWHEKCMICDVCKLGQGSEGFFEDEGKLYHLNCYARLNK